MDIRAVHYAKNSRIIIMVSASKVLFLKWKKNHWHLLDAAACSALGIYPGDFTKLYRCKAIRVDG